MKLPEPLIFGRLIRRYKRFLAEVQLDDGRILTAHCPNTGRMTTCAEPGWRVALSRSDNPKRKYPYTWELVHNEQCWICVNTTRANAVAFEAVSKGWIPRWSPYSEVLREKRFGDSRFDLLLKNGEQKCFVEVKSVTLRTTDGCVAFPDAVTNRGAKHLDELIRVVEAGHRAAMLFVVLRNDGSPFRIANEIDPHYFQALEHAIARGVEIEAWQTQIFPTEIKLTQPIQQKTELLR